MNRSSLAGRGLVYLLLFSGSLIFMWPFLWMVMTSVKLDREMFSTRLKLFPERPIPAMSSPYVDEQLYADVGGERYEEAIEVVSESLRRASDLVWPEDVSKEALIPQVARGIYLRLLTLLPEDVWTGSDAEFKAGVQAEIDQAMLDQMVAQIKRRLSIGQLRVRSYDLEEEELVSGENVAAEWEVVGPGALKQSWERGKAFADLHYDFARSDEDRIVLTRTFDLNFSVERLHKLQLYLRPDNSWHAVSVVVEKLGKRYRSENPNYLSDYNWLAYSWQEPGPDDAKNKIKTWVLLNEMQVGEGEKIEEGEKRLKVSIELARNTDAGAWMAKILRNYRLTFNHVPFWRYVGTSLFLVILNIVLTLFSCSLVAYSFARLQWPGRSICFGLMLATMMIPSQVTMIPHFLIIRWLGWYNTLYPLWVPALFASAFNVFLLRQFLKGIPRDLEDAARIDGCGFWRVYWHVMLPLVRPTLAAIAIFTFMSTWNDFMGPLIYLNDQRLYPLSLGLFALNVQVGGGASSMGLMMAGSLLMTLPVIAIFFMAQRYFLQGVTLTGMKG